MSALVLGLVLAASRAQAQEPPAVDELLRYVADDAAFTVVVRDVRGHARRFGESPFLAQFKQSPVGAALTASKEFDSFEEIDKQLRQFLSVGLTEIRDEVLGDGLVFAYWPAQGGEPERGVFLAKARRADLLLKLVNQLKDLGLKSGDLKRLETRKHKGKDYHQGEDKEGKKTYYLVHDRLLALSEDEASIRHVIDRVGGPPTTSAIARRIEQLGLQDALAVLLVNPRAFDSAIAEKVKSAPESEAAFLRTLSSYWKQTSAVALSVRLQDDLAIGVSLKIDATGLPESTRRFLAEAAKPSALWDQFPERPIFAMAGRLDAAALLDLLLGLTPEPKRRTQLTELEKAAKSALGLDLHKEILPNVGPDWGMFVAAPSAETKGWFPHTVIAIRVQSKPAHKPLDEALFEPLRTLAGIIAISQSKDGQAIEVKTIFRDGVPMVMLTSDQFPPGCRPTLAVKAGCVVLASSPEALALLKNPPTSPRSSPTDRIVLARFSIQEGVAFLNQKERRTALLDSLAKTHGISPAEVDDGLNKLTEVLKLFDQVELVQRTQADQVHLSLHLKTVQPLKK